MYFLFDRLVTETSVQRKGENIEHVTLSSFCQNYDPKKLPYLTGKLFFFLMFLATKFAWIRHLVWGDIDFEILIANFFDASICVNRMGTDSKRDQTAM